MGKVRKSAYGILFGFNTADEDQTGYFAVIDNKITVTTEEELARHFPFRRKPKQKNFGTPQQWCDLINEDELLCHGYRFHVVKKF